MFNVPGVTFVASTGDYGAADPEYPAFSPNVVAVGGTSLTLNADGSYNSETGWGYYSDSAGAFIGSGGGISLYEPEPAYQQGVQSTGSRTTPDVSLVADPATGAWIADPYNLDPSNPFEVVGGTSLSAPAWAGLLALVNQGRAAAGESTLNSTSPTDTQQALYMLPQSDYNVITSGTNGYTASAGYNLVTGLGTPVANLLVPDLVAYHGAGTTLRRARPSARLQNAGLVNTGTSDGGPMDVFSVFDSFTVTSAKQSGPQRSRRRLELTCRQKPKGPPGQSERTPRATSLLQAHRWRSTEAHMMPLDNSTVLDAVLTGWSRRRRSAVRLGFSRRRHRGPGPGRRKVAEHERYPDAGPRRRLGRCLARRPGNGGLRPRFRWKRPTYQEEAVESRRLLLDRWNGSADLIQQRPRAVSLAPLLNVIPVKLATLYGDHVSGVVAVLRDTSPNSITRSASSVDLGIP